MLAADVLHLRDLALYSLPQTGGLLMHIPFLVGTYYHAYSISCRNLLGGTYLSQV
jgi:hypothetical protein